MALEEYAALQKALGEIVVKAGDCFWRRVRPLFYRPLLPFQEITVRDPSKPWPALLGGVQYAVPDDTSSNSSLKLILSTPASEYSLDGLDYNRKRQVRLASKRFAIRPIADSFEFKERAHPIYLAFYERTRYAYKAERQKWEKFASWADTIYAVRQMLILGAYENAELRAVGGSYRVGDTVFYATFFATTEAMKHYVADIMLHSVREIAAGTEGVRQVFAGMLKNEKGLDDFYLLRGFKVVAKPAVVHINPIALLLLGILSPRRRALLVGT